MANRWIVFIDTSIWVRANFSLDSGVFAALKSLCQNERVTILLTDITVQEIETKLREAVNKAKKTLNKARSDARVLRNIKTGDFSVLFSAFDRMSVIETLTKQFHDFCDYTGAVVVEASRMSAKSIFDDYFGRRPPFGADRKKSEFPDAFAVASLNDWASQKGDTVYVVSGDSDFESVCKNSKALSWLKSLPEFIDLVLSDENVLVEIIHEKISHHREKIEHLVAKEFEGLWVILEDVDGDGEIEEVETIELHDGSVIRVDKEKAVVAANALVHLSIYFDYNDPESMHYDNETGTAYYYNRKEEVDTREVNVEIEFEINYDIEEPEVLNVVNVTINRGNPLSFYVDYDAETYYK